MSGIAILKLQRAGFTEQRVQALAEYHEAGAATTTDIGDLENKISDLDRKLDATRSDLEAKIDTFRSDLEIKTLGTRQQTRPDTLRSGTGDR